MTSQITKLLAVFDQQNTPSLATKELKNKALQVLQTQAVPTTKNENWKYSNPAFIFETEYQVANAASISKQIVDTQLFKGLENVAIVFVNGFFAKQYSTFNSNEIVVESLAEAKTKYAEQFATYFESSNISSENVFTAQNTAYANDGVFVYIPKNQTNSTIHIINITTANRSAQWIQQRNLIVADTNSEIRIIETNCSDNQINSSKSFINNVTEIIVNENAKVNYNTLESLGTNQILLNTTKVEQHQYSSFASNVITLSGDWVRNEILVDLKGEGCQTQLNGLYLPIHEEHVDNLTYIKHSNPNCSSSQLYKGIIKDKSKAIFNGKVLVARDAQKTDALQSNKNILLSETAKVNSRPQLEIYADDVKCSHGSTTGQLDKECLFYLQARGIDKEAARALLLYAFASDVLNKIEVEPFKEKIDTIIAEHFLNQ